MKEFFQGLSADEQEADRKHNATRLLVLIIAISFGAAALVAWSSGWAADTMSASDQNGKITLSLEPCAASPWLAEWKTASWLYKGKVYAACWRVQKTTSGADTVIVLDSDGMVTPIDPRQFKRDEGV